MSDLRRREDRGHAAHGRLDTYSCFSFAEYHDPDGARLYDQPDFRLVARTPAEVLLFDMP